MIQFFETESNNSDVPFLSDLLKEPSGKSLIGKTFTVNEVIAVASGKGYLLRTDEFITFIWKKQKLTNQLLEALNFYFEQGTGYTLCAVVDPKAKCGCQLGVDFETTSYWQKKGESFYNSTTALELEAKQGTENPFLPPIFPSNQSRILEQADAGDAVPQKSPQMSQNGSRNSQSRSKVQSSQTNTQAR